MYHTYVHTYIHTYIHTYHTIRTSIPYIQNINTHIHIHTHTHTHTHKHAAAFKAGTIFSFTVSCKQSASQPASQSYSANRPCGLPNISTSTNICVAQASQVSRAVLNHYLSMGGRTATLLITIKSILIALLRLRYAHFSYVWPKIEICLQILAIDPNV
jgi:hypothetical protein